MSDALVAGLRTALEHELPAAVVLRRVLHARPRVSGDEEDTADLVATALAGDPRAGEVVAGTGRVLQVGAGAGPAAADPVVTGAAVGTPTVAVRAELDALPLVEDTGLAYAAPPLLRAMHACGHDVHLAAVVALARAVTRTPHSPPLLVVLQPREEVNASGARDVLASGALQRHRVGAVVGAHVQPQLAAGVVGVTPGGVNAGVDSFRLEIVGVGGHGAYPHTTVDPVLALAAVVVALQQVTSRRIDPAEGAVCTVGTLKAGTAANVVPDSASATGTLRTMSAPSAARLRQVVDEVTRATAAAYGCTGRADFDHPTPVLRNDPALTAATEQRLRAAGLPTDSRWRSFGSDDFAAYGDELPSLMMFAGVGAGVGVGAAGGVDGGGGAAADGGGVGRPAAGLHSTRFDPGEDSVGLVARCLLSGYLAAALDLR